MMYSPSVSSAGFVTSCHSSPASADGYSIPAISTLKVTTLPDSNFAVAGIVTSFERIPLSVVRVKVNFLPERLTGATATHKFSCDSVTSVMLFSKRSYSARAPVEGVY